VQAMRQKRSNWHPVLRRHFANGRAPRRDSNGPDDRERGPAPHAPSAPIEGRDQRLDDGHRAVVGARVAPLQIVRFGNVPVAQDEVSSS